MVDFNLLNGILSNNSKNFDNEIHNIKLAAYHPTNKDEAISIFTICTNFMLEGETQWCRDIAFDIFSFWAKENGAYLSECVSSPFLMSIFSRGKCDRRYCIKILKTCTTVLGPESPFNDILRDNAMFLLKICHQDHQDVFSFLCLFFRAHSETFPTGNARGDCLTFMLRVLKDHKLSMVESSSSLSSASVQRELCVGIKFVNCITACVLHFCLQDEVLLMDCLRYLFTFCCDSNSPSNSPNVSASLGAFFSHIPESAYGEMEKEVLSSNLDDYSLFSCFSCMFHMLRWPPVTISGFHLCSIEKFVFNLLQATLARKRWNVLYELSERFALTLATAALNKLFACRLGNILCFLLLGYRKSSAVFHSVCPLFPRIFNSLLIGQNSKDSTDPCRDICEKLFFTSLCLMQAFPGFPDVYAQLLRYTQSLPQQSTTDVDSCLAASAWPLCDSGSRLYPESLSTRSPGALVGLANLGNTCFANCVLQMLYMCQEFRTTLLRKHVRLSKKIVLELQKVFSLMQYSQRSVLRPSDLLKVALPSWFRPGEQQDCHEFINHLISEMSEVESPVSNAVVTETSSNDNAGASATSEENFRASDFFSGKCSTTYCCKFCHSQSTKTEDFSSISVPITQTADRNLTLVDLLNNSFALQSLAASNAYHCSTCKQLRDGSSRMCIVKSPLYLFLALLRFTYDVGLKRKIKISLPVTFPLTLWLPVHVDSCSRICEKTEDAHIHLCRYSLCTIAMHAGHSSDEGHYYCFSRFKDPNPNEFPILPSSLDCVSGSTQDFSKDKWFSFNDENVSSTRFSHINEVTKTFGRDTPYLLCYTMLDQTCCVTRDLVESIPRSDPVPPNINLEELQTHLRNHVIIDQRLFTKELSEIHEMSKKKRLSDCNSSLSRNNRFNDEDGPPGGCGDKDFNKGTRLVF